MWVHPVIETSKNPSRPSALVLPTPTARAPAPPPLRLPARPRPPTSAASSRRRRPTRTSLPCSAPPPLRPPAAARAASQRHPRSAPGRRQGRLPVPPPLRRIDGLKKPTEKADTVEKKTPGERTKAGKRLLHQRRLRGLGGGGGRPPPHLQTRSTLFRPARSRPPFSSPSLPRQASPLHQAKR